MQVLQGCSPTATYNSHQAQQPGYPSLSLLTVGDRVDFVRVVRPCSWVWRLNEGGTVLCMPKRVSTSKQKEILCCWYTLCCVPLLAHLRAPVSKARADGVDFPFFKAVPSLGTLISQNVSLIFFKATFVLGSGPEVYHASVLWHGGQQKGEVLLPTHQEGIDVRSR